MSTTGIILFATCMVSAAVAVVVMVDPVLGDLLSIPTGILAGAAGLFAAHKARAARRWAWLLLSTAPLFYAIGDTLLLAYRDADGSAPILSLADALYVLALPPAILGLLIYPVPRLVASRWWQLLLDAVVLVLAVTSASQTLALSRVLAVAESWGTGLILVVYPLTDGMLVALCLLLLLRSSGGVRLDVACLGLTFAVYLASDLGYAIATIQGRGYDDDLWVIFGYAVAPVFIAAAALLTALTPTPLLTARRPLTGVIAPSVPVLASLAALALYLAWYPDDSTSRVLITVLLMLVGVRQLVQTSSGQDLRLQLERRIAERNREVEQLAAQYRHLEVMKSGFVSSVSHELRTPLTAIRASLEVLRDGYAGELPSDAQSMVDVATRGSERLSRLVNDIVDLELLENNAFGLERRTTELRSLITESVASLAPLARTAGVCFVVDSPTLEAWCDPDRVVQVITNLIGNALRYAPEGSDITISAGHLSPDVVFIAVSDTGRGIPQEQVEAVFDRFHQVTPHNDRRRGGTGLGLAICRGIVEAHGGQIEVESLVGAGTTFRFTLPTVEICPTEQGGLSASRL